VHSFNACGGIGLTSIVLSALFIYSLSSHSYEQGLTFKSYKVVSRFNATKQQASTTVGLHEVKQFLVNDNCHSMLTITSQLLANKKMEVESVKWLGMHAPTMYTPSHLQLVKNASPYCSEVLIVLKTLITK